MTNAITDLTEDPFEQEVGRPGLTLVTQLHRLPRRAGACMVPQPVSRDGLFEVDATWGTVQPIELAPGVRTIGELELIDHIARGLALVDTRLEHRHRASSIPGAANIPHEEIVDRIGELDADHPTAFFCNGPQCAATPDAVGRLLAVGHPPAAIVYYRGGMHDWMTLGYPTVSPADAPGPPS
jgi:rhodanese-related sulfurtransferase